MKKFAALLTTVLVMAMSATTVFAAVSPTVAGAVKPTEATSEAGTVTIGEVTTVTESQANDAALMAASTIPNIESAEVAAYADIKIEGVTPSKENPVTITMNVAGITASTNVLVRNWDGFQWIDCTVKEVKDGAVVVEFTHLSPVMVITYTVKEASGPVVPPTSEYDTTEEAATPASPKTGVLPVAAIAAGICLAGAAVCGKKVKFN